MGLPPEEVEAAVRVGDVVTLRGRWMPLAGGYAACKSMDDRAAVAVLILCLEELSRRRHDWDVYAVATVQEEVGGVGAVAGAFSIQPTLAIAIDVTFGMQPGLSTAEAVKMDAGPSIALGPNFHPVIHERLAATARAMELPCQVEAISGASGTDAWAIQVEPGRGALRPSQHPGALHAHAGGDGVPEGRGARPRSSLRSSSAGSSRALRTPW